MAITRTYLAMVLFLFLCALSSPAVAQPTELSTGFTYQGRLAEKGEHPTGQYDFQLSLWNLESEGDQLGTTVLMTNVAVADGLFTISPNFGVGVFDGAVQWLQIEVRPSGGAEFTTLMPRQEVKAAPYSLQTRGMFVSVDKNVGIGTTNPQHLLHVQELSGHAIVAESQSTSALQYGVWGISQSSIGRGVYGYAPGMFGMNYGVYGRTDSADDGRGVYGLHSAGSGTGPGVLGQSNSQSANAIGVHGLIQAVTPGGLSAGVCGENRGTGGAGIGVYGSHDGAGWGVYGEAASTGGRGVFGRNDAATSYGVYGLADQIDSYGVHGRSSLGVGVYGLHGTTLTTNPGVLGETNSTVDGAPAVVGRALGATGETIGVLGECVSDSGIGVMGIGNFGDAVGGRFISNSPSGFGLHAENTAGAGSAHAIFATSASIAGRAVHAETTSVSPNARAVYGNADGEGTGVFGQCGSNSGFGVYSSGPCHVTANFTVAGNKSFRIDHPLDPERSYLLHYSEEGPQPRNVYRGRAHLDSLGEAIIEMPEYFEAINIDFEYHLTAIGAPMPNLHIAAEVDDSTFRIAGGEPHKSVSWTVTGIRNDQWVREHGAPVEMVKRPHEVEEYLAAQQEKQSQQQTASAAGAHGSGE